VFGKATFDISSLATLIDGKKQRGEPNVAAELHGRKVTFVVDWFNDRETVFRHYSG